jgi:hypothetical protein
MEGAMAAWEDVYARADGVIKPAVFGVLDKLGWHLTPSARARRAKTHGGRQKARGVRVCALTAPPLADARAYRPAAAAPVTAGLPFVDSPTGLLLCLGAYFVIVFLGVALQSGRAPVPAEAKRPDPFWLRALVLLHNLFLVALSLFMSGGCASAGAARHAPTNPRRKRSHACCAAAGACPMRAATRERRLVPHTSRRERCRARLLRAWHGTAVAHRSHPLGVCASARFPRVAAAWRTTRTRAATCCGATRTSRRSAAWRR